MTTCVTSCSLSQSAKLSRSAATVPKLRFACRFSPFTSQQVTQPYTLFLCTSSPAQRARTTSMAPLFLGCPEGACFCENLLRVLAIQRWRRQFVVPPGFRVKLLCRLLGTTHTATSFPARPTTTLLRLAPIFILRCDRNGHAQLLSLFAPPCAVSQNSRSKLRVLDISLR